MVQNQLLKLNFKSIESKVKRKLTLQPSHVLQNKLEKTLNKCLS
jgi:hypothetical protein